MRNERSVPVLISLLLAVLGPGLAGCERGSRMYLDGLEVSGVLYEPISTREGVHPDRSVLKDRANPFVLASVFPEDRWFIQNHGGDVLAFYAWATWLARAPSGESQYYAALSLQSIYEKGEAEEAHLAQVQQTAIAAFQALLDEFPDSVSYSVVPGTGEVVPFRLAPLSYQGIVALGGKPEHGWTQVLVPDQNGDGEPESTVIQIKMDP